jgi:hypothetical protein
MIAQGMAGQGWRSIYRIMGKPFCRQAIFGEHFIQYQPFYMQG